MDVCCFRKLPWDSDYFKIPCAQIDFYGTCDVEKQEELLNQAHRVGLVYIANHGMAPSIGHWIAQNTNAYLTDVNVQMTKQLLSMKFITQDDTWEWHDSDLEPILEIARTVFIHTRYINDLLLAQKGGKDIYVQWILNAIGLPRKRFIVDRHEGNVRGFLLLSYNEHEVVVELIGVSHQYLRQGVGNRLWNALESIAVQAKKPIRVGTQIANHGALNFYHQMGCQQVECTSVYHWWV